MPVPNPILIRRAVALDPPLAVRKNGSTACDEQEGICRAHAESAARRLGCSSSVVVVEVLRWIHARWWEEGEGAPNPLVGEVL
jgi:hypothetical protein